MKGFSPSQYLTLPPLLKLYEKIRNEKTYIRADARIIFVCGATSTDKWTSNREIILKHVNKHLTTFKFFRAEEVFDALGGTSSTDLLTIEDELGSFSDCIIIICESESSFAELGAFTLSNDLVKQLLIINDKNFESSESFINEGPIKKANKYSVFKPAIFTDYNAITKAVPELQERVLRIPHRRRSAVNIHGVKFSSLKAKDRLLLIAELINLLSPISLKELVALIKKISTSNHISLETELALGISLGFFSKFTTANNHSYLYHSHENTNFLSFMSLNRTEFRADILRTYRQRDRQRIVNLTNSIVNT